MSLILQVGLRTVINVKKKNGESTDILGPLSEDQPLRHTCRATYL